MGNARKHLFWQHKYSTPNYTTCNNQEKDTWVHVLFKCTQSHLYTLQVKRHTSDVWEIHKVLLASTISCCFILVNANTFHNNPLKNTVPTWLLSCTCSTNHYHYNARLPPNLLCMSGLPYLYYLPTKIDPNLTIQFIEFSYTNDRFPTESIQHKIDKYRPFLDDIKTLEWNFDPLIVIIVGARGTTHLPSHATISKTFKLPKSIITSLLSKLNEISIQYLTSIILHKRQIENNQSLPNLIIN
jgi:hypothetical protein